MEEKGWVYREEDPADGRFVRIFCPKSGSKNKELSRRVAWKFNKKVRMFISEEKLNVFCDLLRGQ